MLADIIIEYLCSKYVLTALNQGNCRRIYGINNKYWLLAQDGNSLTIGIPPEMKIEDGTLNIASPDFLDNLCMVINNCIERIEKIDHYYHDIYEIL